MDKGSPEITQFVRLGLPDVGDVLPLETRCFTMPWSAEQFRAAFAEKHFAAFGLRGLTAKEPDRPPLTAYVSLYHIAGELEILNLAVDPDHRRRGLGKKLLSMMLQVARKMGIQRAVLEVRMHNVPALALYRGLGFLQVGSRPHYYADTGEDAHIYQYVFV